MTSFNWDDNANGGYHALSPPCTQCLGREYP